MLHSRLGRFGLELKQAIVQASVPRILSLVSHHRLLVVVLEKLGVIYVGLQRLKDLVVVLVQELEGLACIDLLLELLVCLR